MDLNANLHGNWTLENAKARLNQFFQKEKTSAEYKYSQVGPDHNRSGPEPPHQQKTNSVSCFRFSELDLFKTDFYSESLSLSQTKYSSDLLSFSFSCSLKFL